MEGLRGEGSIAALCRREGLNPNLYYRWSKEFLEAGKKRLLGDTTREATSTEVADVRKNVAELKQVVAELVLENRLLKKSVTGVDSEAGTGGGRRARRSNSSGSWRARTCPCGRPCANCDSIDRPSTRGIAGTRSGGGRDSSRSPAPAGGSGTAFPRGCASAWSTPPWPTPSSHRVRLAWHFTDREGHFLSESSVYRILRAYDLIPSPAYVVLSAAKTFQHPTRRPHELWQTDFTYLQVVSWGWYYLSTVLDDYSRYIVAWTLRTSMQASDVTETLDLARAATGVSTRSGSSTGPGS